MAPGGRLVLVGGSPGAGKSTLAAEIARRHPRAVVVDKDDLKEVLADAEPALLGVPLGRPTWRLSLWMAGRVVAAGGDAVLVSNFRAGQSEAELAPLVSASAAVLQVHCEVPAHVALQRIRDRARAHPVHTDLDTLELVRRDIESGGYRPLLLQVPTVTVGGGPEEVRRALTAVAGLFG